MSDKRKGVPGDSDSHPCEVDRCGGEVAVTIDEVSVLLTLRQAVMLAECLELGPETVEALEFQRPCNVYADSLRVERHGTGWEVEVVSHHYGIGRFSADWTGSEEDRRALSALLDEAISE